MSNPNATKRYEVRYVGAPYGDNESGHLMSWHRTREAAERAARKLSEWANYYNHVRIVERQGRS